MQLVTNIVNARSAAPSVPAGKTQIDTHVLERLRISNANLQKQVLEAQNKALAALAKQGDSAQVANMKDQLAKAHKTIAELEQKVKTLTANINESVAKIANNANTAKKDKKFDRVDKTDKAGVAANVSESSGIKISVN